HASAVARARRGRAAASKRILQVVPMPILARAKALRMEPSLLHEVTYASDRNEEAVLLRFGIRGTVPARRGRSVRDTERGRWFPRISSRLRRRARADHRGPCAGDSSSRSL